MSGPTHRYDGELNERRLEASATNIDKDALDCGITAIECCNSPGCQKLATTKSFLIVLTLVGTVQGAIERYFAVSARQAGVQFGYDPVTLEWLLVTAGIAQGVLAIVIAYWANRVHRISWMGALLIFQALTSLAVIIPILVNQDDLNGAIVAHEVNQMCTERTIESLTDELTYSVTTLAMLFVLQIAIGLGHIAFYSLGISYIDDNVKEVHSPALIGAALAAKISGSQLGSTLAYGVSATSLGWWLGWAILAPVLFVLAVLMCLFPKQLIKTVVRQAADTIVEALSSQHDISIAPQNLLADISFGSSLRRIITNKVLVFNVLAAVFVETAIVNFWAHETSYVQARFYVPTDESGQHEWSSRMWATMLRPSSIATSVLLGGLIISKAKPSAKKLAIWNIATGVVVGLLFVAFIFIDCDRSPVAGGYNGYLNKPFCSRSCICDPNIRFSPVCPADSVQTYFSPCHAGCADELSINGIRTFTNCTCGADTDLVITAADTIATDGACGFVDCESLWISFLVLSISGASVFATGMVANLLLTIRSALPQDKALSLATELTLLGLVVYIPGHIGYQAIADMTCQYWSQEGDRICLLHASDSFSMAINIVSAVLVLIGIFFDVLVLIFVGDMPIYGDEGDGEYRMIPMERFNVANRDVADTSRSYRPVATADNATQMSPGPQATPDVGNVIRFQFDTNQPAASSPSISERMRLSQLSASLSPNSSSGPTYARVYRPPATDELDFHLQARATEPNDHNVRPSDLLRRNYGGGDINPSRGNAIEFESELDISQLEESVSPISVSPQLSESPVNRGKNGKTVPGKSVFKKSKGEMSPETNF